MEIEAIREDIKATKTLAEDVHIMAINMQNMQKAQDEMNKKIDDLTSREFVEYKENKKLIKDKIISGIVGAGVTAVIGFVSFLIMLFVKEGM